MEPRLNRQGFETSAEGNLPEQPKYPSPAFKERVARMAAESEQRGVQIPKKLLLEMEDEALQSALTAMPGATTEQVGEIARENYLLRKERWHSEREARRQRRLGPAPEVVRPTTTVGQTELGQDFASLVETGAPMVGSLLGAPLGLQGSMLGAGGATLFVTPMVEAFKREAARGQNLTYHPLGVFGMLRKARNEMLLEYAGSKFFDYTIGGVASYFRGDPKLAAQIMKDFETVRLSPALQDLSNASLPESARKMLGGFPTFSGIFARRQQDMTEQVGKRLTEAANRAGLQPGDIPDSEILRRVYKRSGLDGLQRASEAILNNTFKVLDRGMKLFGERQEQAWTAFYSRVSRLEREAAEAGGRYAIDPVQYRGRLAEAAEGYKALVDEGAFPATEVLTEVDNALRAAFDRLKDTPNMTMSELRADIRKVTALITKMDDEAATTVLGRVKEGLQEDLKRLAQNDPESLTLYNRASEVSEEFLTFMQDEVAQRLKRVSRNVGRRERDVVDSGPAGLETAKGAGARDPIATMGLILDSNSPRTVRNFFRTMKEAAGERKARRIFGRVAAQRINTAVERITQPAAERSAADLFKPGRLLKELGLEGVTDPTRALSAKTLTNLELYRSAGIDRKQLIALSNVIDHLFSVKTATISEFVRRRALLGGFRTVVGGYTGGALASSTGEGEGSVLGAAAGALSFVLLGRSFAKWMTDPVRARRVIQIADQSLPDNTRARAFVSLLNDADIVGELGQGDGDGFAANARRQALEQMNTPRSRREALAILDDYLNAGPAARVSGRKAPPAQQ